MGWFDNFRRTRNEEQQVEQTQQPDEEQIEEVQEGQQKEVDSNELSEPIVEDGFEIDTVSVVEREIQQDVKPIEEVELKPIKTYAEKKPVSRVVMLTDLD